MYNRVNMVTVYTTKTCHYCGKVKEYLTARGINYQELNASEPANKQKVLELTGKLAVPVVVDGKWMASGFDEAEFDKHFALDK